MAIWVAVVRVSEAPPQILAKIVASPDCRTHLAGMAAKRDLSKDIEGSFNPKRKDATNGILSPADAPDRRQDLSGAGVGEARRNSVHS